MHSFATASLLLAAVAPAVFAQSGTKCGPQSQCPEDTPCCSQYGECGTGAYCLGGCDPVSSFSLDACVPAPICESKSYNFNSLDGMVSNTKYLGDASKADWVYSGEPVEYDNSVLLTMAQGTVGTLLANTHYVWYGKIGATFKTSAGAGVVTAFILLGDTKDEIDFEFIGVDLMTAQTNFYSQGVTNYNNGKNASISSNSLMNYHDYEIDWQPDTLTWSIDGNVVRTLQKSDTWNATANRFDYPQTPCRVQLSLWPAGLPTNPQGTINWAGGEISWNSPYMNNNQYYYSQFDSVDIECYDPPSGANVQGSKSYIITDKAMTNNTVEVTDDSTILASFEATGLNKGAGNTTSSSTGGNSNNTVPGLSGGGADANRGGNAQSSGDAGSSSDSGSPTAAATGSSSTGFVQGGSSGASSNMPEQVLSGSLFAAIIAIVGLCVL